MSREVMPTGEALIKEWLSANARVEMLRREFSSAECALNDSSEKLARWLLPEDVKHGEKICVWYGDSLIQVEF